ncbi:MAG: integrin alpha [Planctomycetota bacterium]
MPGAGEVEFFPTINSPGAPRFQISAPSGHVQANAHFGWPLATADIDDNGTIDLVVGAPHQDVAGVTDQGRAFVLFGPGSPTNPTPYANWAYLEVDPGEVSDPGANEPGGQFGDSLYGEQEEPYGLGDVVVGLPGADSVIYGLDTGGIRAHFGHGPALNPIWNNDWPWTENQPPVLVSTQPSQQFGSSIAVRDADNDGWDDFLVGAPGTSSGPRGYVVLNQAFQIGFQHHSGRYGPNPDELGDLYGTSVGWAYVNGPPASAPCPAVIGAPGGLDGAGYVEVLVGDFTMHSLKLWTQWAYYPNPIPEPDEAFGYALARALRFGTVNEDLVIGTPHANIPGYADAGEVFVYNH